MPIWEMVDNTAFDHISSISSPSPKSLHPLPVLGIPGWWNNQYEEFYNNTNYFRSKKLRPIGWLYVYEDETKK